MKIFSILLLPAWAEFSNFDDFLNPNPKYNETCDSSEAAKLCESACGDVLLECAYGCQNVECADQCKADFYQCTEYCPCHAQCPNGCLGCDSWACLNECSVPEENEDKIQVFECG